MGSSYLDRTIETSLTMNFKILLSFCICLIGTSFALPMPWIQGPDFSGLAKKEIDLANPVTGDPSDPHIYYIFRYPMTCGELCFNGLGCGICEDGGDEDVSTDDGYETSGGEGEDEYD